MAHAMHRLDTRSDREDFIRVLLSRMTLEEKIGQLNQLDASPPNAAERIGEAIASGAVGSVLNQVEREGIAELQRIAVEDSRLGVPLIFARDVIHGFKTVAPLPIGQAASWNPDLVRACARAAAGEAASQGIRWTFAPMVDISRDARWGRIAECLGEDPKLASDLGAAMVEGFQGDDLTSPGSVAACVKHFAGYGASEAGRDYFTTNIPENELRNVYLPPFKAALEAGAASIMTSFGDVDGVPATGNDFLLKDILRDEWSFIGVVLSDWDAIAQLAVHGLCESDREAAAIAAEAGVDMDMMSSGFIAYLPSLVREGRISEARVDEMAARVLGMKWDLGLFEDPYGEAHIDTAPPLEEALETMRQAAREGFVLLKNDHNPLPLDFDALSALAVIGPMADQPYEQLGTWIFDGDAERSVTPLAAIREAAEGRFDVHFAPGLANSRDRDESGFDAALEAARKSDAIILVLGEESILSGEAHCLADISLPGHQRELLGCVRQAGKPVIGVILAGRPLALDYVMSDFDALIYGFHPGAMTGPALVDLLSGAHAPSGKLPLTFPKVTGQIPIYYNHKNSGRPPAPDKVIHIDQIPEGAGQTSLGMSAFHLDAGYEPLFPFGFGLSYTHFQYSDLRLDRHEMTMDETLTATITLTNTGGREAEEVCQLYIRDPAASLTRPVRELKAYRRVRLKPGESVELSFELTAQDLAFSRRDRTFGAEPGRFDLWIGGDSRAHAHAGFRLIG